MRHALLLAGVLGAGLTLAGCTTPEMAGPPAPPPPAPPEVIPKPPVTATPLIWQPGHWDWNGSGYVWTPGEYVPRGGHSDMFMPGYWAQSPTGGWQWQPPHWLAAGG
ncbi:MAG TPA: hypothetical protein VFA03_03805 [Acetobacteraceae bacterium]|nr:hypothetical protein [Acetobacteraceae bacterium]